jgi:hypothetical protein
MIFARHTGQAQAERFHFRHWSAAGPAEKSAEPVGGLYVTDIVISPDNRYCFDVMAGPRRVISFFFDNLENAAAAARDLQALLPSVLAVLRDSPRRNALSAAL